MIELYWYSEWLCTESRRISWHRFCLPSIHRWILAATTRFHRPHGKWPTIWLESEWLDTWIQPLTNNHSSNNYPCLFAKFSNSTDMAEHREDLRVWAQTTRFVNFIQPIRFCLTRSPHFIGIAHNYVLNNNNTKRQFATSNGSSFSTFHSRFQHFLGAITHWWH